MDAVPVTLGQEFGGYATAVELGVDRLRSARAGRLCALPLGGTAVGTGLNAPPGFAPGASQALAERAGPRAARGRGPLRGPGRPGRAGRAQRQCAASWRVSLNKLATDLRWMAFGTLRPDWPRSACPICSRAARSCPARSTRCCPRRCTRSSPRSSATTPPIAMARRVGSVRAERDAARHGRQPVGLDPSSSRTSAACWPIAASTASRRTRRRCRRHAESSPSLVTALVPADRLRGSRGSWRTERSRSDGPSVTSCSRSGLATPEQLDEAPGCDGDDAWRPEGRPRVTPAAPISPPRAARRARSCDPRTPRR